MTSEQKPGGIYSRIADPVRWDGQAGLSDVPRCRDCGAYLFSEASAQQGTCTVCRSKEPQP